MCIIIKLSTFNIVVADRLMTSRLVSLLCLLVLTTAYLSVSQLIPGDDKEFLLDFHNDARDNVAPIATNMEKMVSCTASNSSEL